MPSWQVVALPSDPLRVAASTATEHSSTTMASLQCTVADTAFQHANVASSLLNPGRLLSAWCHTVMLFQFDVRRQRSEPAEGDPYSLKVASS